MLMTKSIFFLLIQLQVYLIEEIKKKEKKVFLRVKLFLGLLTRNFQRMRKNNNIVINMYLYKDQVF